MDTKNAVITTSPRCFRRKAENVSLIVKKSKKNEKHKKTDLHNDPLVSVNAVLTTPPKLSLQSPRMIKNFYFFQKIRFCFSSIRCDGHGECSNYNFAEVFLTKGRKVFAQCTKTLKKHINQKNDLQKDPIVSVNAVLTTPPKLSLQSPRSI